MLSTYHTPGILQIPETHWLKRIDNILSHGAESLRLLDGLVLYFLFTFFYHGT